eukprot:scpid46381/ scgid0744/ E-selectin; CD62 antigen-like family member E; Endothelial leukocyte adhesion molecule 1; Leukocyte-endothelial cell adhesion molecule 2
MVECAGNFTWNGSEPVCENQRCRSLSIPANGHRLYQNSTWLYSIARFDCETGYTLNGSSVLHCGPDLNWNASEPECQNVSNQCEPIQRANCTSFYSQERLAGSEAMVVCSSFTGNILALHTDSRTLLHRLYCNESLEWINVSEYLTGVESGGTSAPAETISRSVVLRPTTAPSTEDRLLQENSLPLIVGCSVLGVQLVLAVCVCCCVVCYHHGKPVRGSLTRRQEYSVSNCQHNQVSLSKNNGSDSLTTVA